MSEFLGNNPVFAVENCIHKHYGSDRFEVKIVLSRDGSRNSKQRRILASGWEVIRSVITKIGKGENH